MTALVTVGGENGFLDGGLPNQLRQLIHSGLQQCFYLAFVVKDHPQRRRSCS